MKYLLAIDPGLATGLGLIDVTDMDNPKKIWTKEVNIAEFYLTVPEVIEEYADKGLEVVCENFIITIATAKKSQSPWSLNLIGIVQYFCFMNDAPLHLPKPGEREFTSNDMLRHFDLWHVGGAGHANQAMRHAFAFLVRKNKKLAIQALDMIESKKELDSKEEDE